MKATDHIKRAAFEKAVDYFLADPEHNIVKIMDLIDKVAPKDLFSASSVSWCHRRPKQLVPPDHAYHE